jgi:hypothetical protein
LIAVALLLASQTSTTSVPRVALIPTYGKPIESGASVLDARVLRAFTRELHSEAARVFQERRWSVASRSSVARAIRAWGDKTRCLDARCYDPVAKKVGATHWLAARMIEAPEQRCFATVALEDLIQGKRTFRAEQKIEPCTVDNAVAVARELARNVAKGPRAPVAVTESFTDLQAPSIELLSIPDVEAIETSTTPRAHEELGLDRALAIYKKRHLIAFSQELEEREWHVLIAQNGQLVDECTVRKAAGLEIDEALETYCEGNHWEWAWIGVPVGALVSIGSFRGLLRGTAPGVLGFVFGAIAAVVSGSLALALNVDAAELDEGEYWSDQRTLEGMVEIGNRELRKKLDLTAAEVEAAGMRR